MNIGTLIFIHLLFFDNIYILKPDRSSDHATNRWPTGPAAVNVSLYKGISIGAANCNAATAAITIIIGID